MNYELCEINIKVISLPHHLFAFHLICMQAAFTLRGNPDSKHSGAIHLIYHMGFIYIYTYHGFLLI